MKEQMAKGLASTLGGTAESRMPGSRTWGVLVDRPDGGFAAVEDWAGWAYRDRSAFDASQVEGDPVGLTDSREWGEWDGGEAWAHGLSCVLGSPEYWHSGGGIWLVFHTRQDGRFAVIGSESGAVYPSKAAFEADEYGLSAETQHYV